MENINDKDYRAFQIDKSDNVEKEVTLIKADNTSFLEKLIEKFIIK